MHCGKARVNQGDSVFCLFMAPQFQACGWISQTHFKWEKEKHTTIEMIKSEIGKWKMENNIWKEEEKKT